MMFNKVGFTPVQMQKLSFGEKTALGSVATDNRYKEGYIANKIIAGFEKDLDKAVLKDRFVLPTVLKTVANSLPNEGTICAKSLKDSLLKTAKGIETTRNN